MIAALDRATRRAASRVRAGLIDFTRRAGLLAASLAFLFAAPAARASAERLFDAPLSLTIEREPSCVAIADLDRDSLPDLVVGSSYTSRLSVLLKKSDGSFGAPPGTGSFAQSPVRSIAAADLDGDSVPDLVTANTAASSFTVLLGNGDGTFQASSYSTSGTPRSVAIAELNGDAHPDLAMSSSLGSVLVLLGNGDGTFQPAVSITAGANPNPIAIADLDRDGRADLVVGNSGAMVTVLLGNGDGSFQAATAFPAGGTPRAIAVADLNGDSWPDLAMANGASSSILLNRGDGSFDSPIAGPAQAAQAIAVVDLDGDSRPDLVLSEPDGWILAWAFGVGDGTFADLRTMGIAEPFALAAARLDRDARPDLVVAAGRFWGQAVVVHCDGTRDLTSFRNYATGDYPASVAVADFDRDGRPDLGVANESSPFASVLLGNGDGTFQDARSLPVQLWSSSVAAADLDRDGNPDLAVSHSRPSSDSTGSVSILLGRGDGSFEPAISFATVSSPRALAIADLDGDARPDLILANADSSKVSVLMGNGDGSFGASRQFGFAGGSRALAVADLDRDGRLDLAVANGSAVSVLRGNGDGTFAVGGDFAAGADLNSVEIADLNGDSAPDVVVGRNGHVLGVAVLIGNGDGTFQAARGYLVRDDVTSLAVADFDRDGHPDVAAVQVFAPPVISLLLGNGDGTLQPKRDYFLGDGYPIPLFAADLDDDSRPDLVAGDWALSKVWVLRNLGPDGTTSVLVSLFEAGWTPEGITLRWRLGDPGRFARVGIERAPAEVGPWLPVAGERLDDGQTTILLDRDVEEGRTYFYRLVGTTTEGRLVTFAPIAVTAGGAIGRFELARVAPSPSSGPVRIEFVVPHRAAVRLGVLDVQGRTIARLVDGVHPPGRLQAVWDGTLGGERRPGVYFVRFEAPGTRETRRVVILE